MSGDAVSKGTFAALSVGSLFLEAWAIMLLWGWFISPLGVKTIGFAWALGIGLFGSLFTQFIPGATDDKHDAERCGRALAVPTLAIGIGFICHSVMR